MPRDALRHDGQPEFSAARGGLRRDPDPPARHRLEGHAGQEKSQGEYLKKNAAFPLGLYPRPIQMNIRLRHVIIFQAAVGAVGDGVSAIPLHGYRPPQRDVQLDHDVQDHLRLLPALRPVPPGD